uniref:Uncharacterized protein n=1 Tax=Esox lucius TaxID=8010 RepID=A0AAY5JVD3_ESOLU
MRRMRMLIFQAGVKAKRGKAWHPQHQRNWYLSRRSLSPAERNQTWEWRMLMLSLLLTALGLWSVLQIPGENVQTTTEQILQLVPPQKRPKGGHARPTPVGDNTLPLVSPTLTNKISFISDSSSPDTDLDRRNEVCTAALLAGILPHRLVIADVEITVYINTVGFGTKNEAIWLGRVEESREQWNVVGSSRKGECGPQEREKDQRVKYLVRCSQRKCTVNVTASVTRAEAELLFERVKPTLSKKERGWGKRSGEGWGLAWDRELGSTDPETSLLWRRPRAVSVQDGSRVNTTTQNVKRGKRENRSWSVLEAREVRMPVKARDEAQRTITVHSQSGKTLCSWADSVSYGRGTWSSGECVITVHETRGKWDITVQHNNEHQLSLQLTIARFPDGTKSYPIAWWNPDEGGSGEESPPPVALGKEPLGPASRAGRQATPGATAGWSWLPVPTVEQALLEVPTQSPTVRVEDDHIEVFKKYGWYRWAQYTARQHEMEDCLICSRAGLANMVVVPIKEGWQSCLKEKFELWKNGTDDNRLYKPCAATCLAWLGNKKLQNEMRNSRSRLETTVECQELNIRISKTIAEHTLPEGDVKILGRHECYYATGTVKVGHFLKCKTLINLNKGELNIAQSGKEFTLAQRRGVRSIYLDQDQAIADIFWICGGGKLRPVLPKGWSGTCARVRVAQDVSIIPRVFSSPEEVQQTEETLVKSRVRRAYTPDPVVVIDAIGQPRGIPNEFKARSEITSGLESIFLWITPNKNTEWINYIYYNQQRFINYTDAALTALGEQLRATSKMAWQNRQALDWILAERGGVCIMFGEQCCTFIPNNTAPDGTFTQAMVKLKRLRQEVKDNAGRDAHAWDWLENSFGRWGAILTKAGIVMVIVLVLLALGSCCVIPLLKIYLTRTVNTQMLLQGTHDSDSDSNSPLVNPRAGHPGQYVNVNGAPCDMSGEPLYEQPTDPVARRHCSSSSLAGMKGLPNLNIPVMEAFVNQLYEEMGEVYVDVDKVNKSNSSDPPGSHALYDKTSRRHYPCPYRMDSCQYCSKECPAKEGHYHHPEPYNCALCQRGDCPLCAGKDCVPLNIDLLMGLTPNKVDVGTAD